MFHRDAIRGSVGAVFRLRCAAATTERALGWLRDREITIVATTPAATEPYWALSYAGGVAVALGGERHGLPDAWLDAAADHVVVPAHGPSTASTSRSLRAVVLCEAARARLRSPAAAV